MKLWSAIFILTASAIFFSCEKNMVSKIPHISLTALVPDSMRVGYDTAYIVFKFTDGDADLGNDTSSSVYIKDLRFDTAGFRRYNFPVIDATIEDPKKGLSGTGYVLLPDSLTKPRPDTLHLLHGDTIAYEMYITDRARNQSNHIFTPSIIIRP